MISVLQKAGVFGGLLQIRLIDLFAFSDTIRVGNICNADVLHSVINVI